MSLETAQCLDSIYWKKELSWKLFHFKNEKSHGMSSLKGEERVTWPSSVLTDAEYRHFYISAYILYFHKKSWHCINLINVGIKKVHVLLTFESYFKIRWIKILKSGLRPIKYCIFLYNMRAVTKYDKAHAPFFSLLLHIHQPTDYTLFHSGPDR